MKGPLPAVKLSPTDAFVSAKAGRASESTAADRMVLFIWLVRPLLVAIRIVFLVLVLVVLVLAILPVPVVRLLGVRVSAPLVARRVSVVVALRIRRSGRR